MKRPVIFFTLCLLWFLPALCSSAEELVLISEEGGYSIALPEGWKRIDAAGVMRSAPMDGSELSEKAREQMKNSAQGASLQQADLSAMETLIVFHAENAAMGISAADVNNIAVPGNPLAEKIRKQITDCLKKGGLQELPSENPLDGLAADMAMKLPDGSGLYGITHIRFTREHVIVAGINRISKDAGAHKDELCAILDGLNIGSDKSLMDAQDSLSDTVR